MSLGLWDLWTCLTDSNLKNTHVQIKLPHLTTFTFCLKYFHYGHFSCTFSGTFRVCSQNVKAMPMFVAARSYKTPIHFSDSNRLGLWQSVSYVSGAYRHPQDMCTILGRLAELVCRSLLRSQISLSHSHPRAHDHAWHHHLDCAFRHCIISCCQCPQSQWVSFTRSKFLHFTKTKN